MSIVNSVKEVELMEREELGYLRGPVYLYNFLMPHLEARELIERGSFQNMGTGSCIYTNNQGFSDNLIGLTV